MRTIRLCRRPIATRRCATRRVTSATAEVANEVCDAVAPRPMIAPIATATAKSNALSWASVRRSPRRRPITATAKSRTALTATQPRPLPPPINSGTCITSRARQLLDAASGDHGTFWPSRCFGTNGSVWFPRAGQPVPVLVLTSGSRPGTAHRARGIPGRAPGQAGVATGALVANAGSPECTRPMGIRRAGCSPVSHGDFAVCREGRPWKHGRSPRALALPVHPARDARNVDVQ